MCRFSEEMFLSDYFTFDAVVGRFCDSRAIFDCLSQTYYIDSERADKLFILATSAKIRNVATIKDYKRYRRLCKYSEACVLHTSYTAAEDDILTIKGKALYATNECGLADSGNATKASVYANIVDKANAGQVTALRLYGVLQCEGVFFDKRLHDGLKNLTRAARWNSVEGILALLKYDANNSATYADMLYTLAVGTPFEEVFTNAQRYHSAKAPKKVKECTLLSKVFGRGQVNPNVYMPVYANLLYSEIISFKDKEKLLLSESKDSINSYMDLPLKLSMRKFTYDVSAITELSITRAEEQSSIIQNALNSDIRHFSTFKPLCLCSDSRFMRSYYAKAIKNLFVDANSVDISVIDLAPHDFEPGMNNVFVRSCDEDKNNVFLISFVGEINEQAAKEVCDFLQGDKRKNMHLVRPNIEIDLGAVLPICLCDKANAQMLLRHCEKVEILNPTKGELTVLIQELISEKEKQYGIKRLNVAQSVMNKLCSVSIDAAEAALDSAITANRSGNNELTLTDENASKYIKRREQSRGFGYGGSKDEN